MLLPTARRLQVFVAVVETGSFAGAARRLGIAQPSVSAHIMAMERELNVTLFVRKTGRQAALSVAGRSLLTHARGLLNSARKLEADVASHAQDGQKVLSVACQRSLANSLMRETLSQFARHHRDIRTTVRAAIQEEVVDAVGKGAADVGCVLGAGVAPDLSPEVIARVRLVVFASPQHPLAKRKSVSPRTLGKYDFVGPPENSHFGRTTTHALESIGVEPIHINSEGTEFGLLRDLAAAGLGLCCSLLASVREDLDAKRLSLIPIDAPPLFVDVFEIRNPKRAEMKPVKLFSESLRASASHWS